LTDEWKGIGENFRKPKEVEFSSPQTREGKVAEPGERENAETSKEAEIKKVDGGQ